MRFEGLVRQNLAPDLTPPKRAQSLSCNESNKTVILQFGKGGGGKISTISYSLSITHYMTKQQKEIKDEGT